MKHPKLLAGNIGFIINIPHVYFRPIFCTTVTTLNRAEAAVYSVSAETIGAEHRSRIHATRLKGASAIIFIPLHK